MALRPISAHFTPPRIFFVDFQGNYDIFKIFIHHYLYYYCLLLRPHQRLFFSEIPWPPQY